ncbi:MAG TPA: hypothetical protein VE843_12770 [Ktedonobacteraceae bacterium]|nr:hypothetical protein [Ktedonobacteraceae bacterium]
MSEQQIWDLWIPDVASQGVSFARGRLNATQVLLVHAAPEKLSVEVYDDNRNLLAQGVDLQRTANTPMARLRLKGKQVTREDIWPSEADLSRPVILAGGEVGILQHWWNDKEEQQWRWRLEFYNHR